jgi:hypothetical protein
MAFRTYSPRGAFLAAHMAASLARQAPDICRHCHGAGCGCGQAEARQAVDAAKLLPLPEGSAVAEEEARALRAVLPSGPLTRARMQSLALGAENLGRFWALGRNTAEVAACAKVARLAFAAADRMP